MERASASRQGRATWNEQGFSPMVVGCGFIGSRIVEELLTAGITPTVLTRRQPEGRLAAQLPDERLHIGDAGDPAALEAALEGVDHVVYTAGGLLPAASEEDPDRDERLTLRPLKTLIAALRGRPGIGFSYISSGGTVYGEPERIPVPETAPTRPIGSYGKLHLECEREIELAREERGLRSCIMRCSSVYGERQQPDRGQGAVATFLHRVEHGLPIDLYGGGRTIRDYIYVGDVARVVLGLAGTDAPPLLNVGSGQGASLTELLKLVEAEVGREAVVHSHPERAFDVHQIVLDIDRLRGALDFEPLPLREGVARTHAWLSANVAPAA